MFSELYDCSDGEEKEEAASPTLQYGAADGVNMRVALLTITPIESYSFNLNFNLYSPDHSKYLSGRR